MNADPVATNPELYRAIFENEDVRVLEYVDQPGERTRPHSHPDSVMYTLTSFKRRLASGGRETEIELPAGAVRWLPAQEHAGANIGATETRVIFVELKRPPGAPTVEGRWGRRVPEPGVRPPQPYVPWRSARSWLPTTSCATIAPAAAGHASTRCSSCDRIRAADVGAKTGPHLSGVAVLFIHLCALSAVMNRWTLAPVLEVTPVGRRDSRVSG